MPTILNCRPRLHQTSVTISLAVPTSAFISFQDLHRSSSIALAPVITMGNEAGPGVGFEYPSFEVKWLKRDLLLFAASIGATYPDELHFLYVRSVTHAVVQHCTPVQPLTFSCSRSFIRLLLRSQHTPLSFPSSTPIKRLSTSMPAATAHPSRACPSSTPRACLMENARSNSSSLFL